MGEPIRQQKPGDKSVNPGINASQGYSAKTTFGKLKASQSPERISLEKEVSNLIYAGFRLANEGWFAEAAEKYSRAIYLWSENPRICIIYFERARMEINTGKCDEALEDLRCAKKAGFEASRFYYEKGRAYFYRKTCGGNEYALRQKYEAYAVKNFNKAEKQGFSDLYLFHYRGRAKLSLGDFAGALEDLNRMIPADPNKLPKSAKLEMRSFFPRGMCKLGLGDCKGALSDFAESEKWEYKNPYLHAAEAGAYSLLGMEQEAIDEYSKAIAFGHPNLMLSMKKSELETALFMKRLKE